MGELSSASKIFIDDAPSVGLLEMRAKARRLKAESGLDLLIVDYLQLVSGGGGRNDNRQQEISTISRGLKALAKELDIPVIALSQLSRAPEQRTESHRTEALGLERVGLHRAGRRPGGVHIPRGDVQDRPTRNKGVADLIIGKQRNGPTGRVKLAFLQEYTRFENLWEE